MSSSIVMKRVAMATVGATLISASIGAAAQATVLTFDDLAPPTIDTPIPDGYGGFTWQNFYYLNASNRGLLSTGYGSGTVSGTNVAYNGFGDLAIARRGVFDFNSAYLTGAWNNGLSVTVEGLKNGASLYSRTVVVNTAGPTLFNFNYRNIDELQFTSFGGVPAGFPQGSGTQFVMDNFSYKAVPEPTSVLGTLALSTFGASALLKRKKQKQA